MADKAPESPTTIKPLDFSDDEDAQESAPAAAAAAAAAAASSPSPTNPQTTTSDEAPPPKPPRPATEQQKNEAILKEAFPSIDASVIKAVLIASGGRIDPAFNALLAMSDPDAVQHDAAEETPPPQPPRPQNTQSQLEADEAYARRLAEHYESSAYEARTSNRGPPSQPRRRQETGLKPNELYDDREHSFIDDDLPVIQEQLKKGFQETQTKVNSWFKDLKKKFDEQFDENGGPSQQHGQYGGSAGGEPGRRSRDYERYDADPELLSDDFAGMKFHSDGTPARPGQPNPNVFRPPPSSTSPKPSDARKVAFKEGAEEIDIYNASPKNTPKDATPSKTSKWQPLSNVDPDPIADNDPFSLGDSDDDKDAKDKPDKAGIKMDDSEERLRKAAAEAMADSLVDDKAKKDEATK
ncbi:hypothetical protein M406DRAFT_290512 [Cryphonectria parasitica EP155]|uniref:CUE domain-containing protein n=1 Tax=Cryphonectria parasitica (strain ATCC 38755 / EP155) TaxID=660469 RepID=A0A9P5CQJ5_CRYP1|nr:uncharacterized protein M406DRAFT_290512 [Cryphonectria parasitica EP155]KAF3766130.1 hypothetical protein M406DRAFT_290512 [Cryphonectria parasitica EP155]